MFQRRLIRAYVLFIRKTVQLFLSIFITSTKYKEFMNFETETIHSPVMVWDYIFSDSDRV